MCRSKLLHFLFYYILCAEMALLHSEISDEYCIYSLYPMSSESRDDLVYWNHC